MNTWHLNIHDYMDKVVNFMKNCIELEQEEKQDIFIQNMKDTKLKHNKKSGKMEFVTNKKDQDEDL